MNTRIKICGLTREADAEACAEHGADAIGLVFYPRSPRCIDARRARAIDRVLPPFVTRVGLFVNATVAEVEAVLSEVAIDVLQFHGEEEPEFCAAFRRPYIKAARMHPGLDLLEYAARFSRPPAARGILCDAWVEGYGGGGRTFDWQLVPAGLPLPLILSGGLDSRNVRAAITALRPAAVDVSSGVELSKGIKDPAKIAAFVTEVRAADETLRFS